MTYKCTKCGHEGTSHVRCINCGSGQAYLKQKDFIEDNMGAITGAAIGFGVDG